MGLEWDVRNGGRGEARVDTHWRFKEYDTRASGPWMRREYKEEMIRRMAAPGHRHTPHTRTTHAPHTHNVTLAPVLFPFAVLEGLRRIAV